jgi:hypothetical protein
MKADSQSFSTAALTVIGEREHPAVAVVKENDLFGAEQPL